MDVAKLIGQLIEGYMEDFYGKDFESEDYETNNTIQFPTSVTFRYDEFDTRSPALQVLLENFPTRTTWIIGGLYKVEHRVRITIYQKLIHYKESDVVTYKSIWFQLKQLIDDVLIQFKFKLMGVNNLITGAWTDTIPSIAVGRGVKTTKEPIVWRSEQVVTCVYYENKELIGA